MAKVSILFSTLNGAHTLPRMLDQLERLRAPSGGWEVIAVDNGSVDKSQSILTERVPRLPMRVVSEPRHGKNVALNTALPLAQGDIIAFTDDDILLSTDWLVCIERIANEKPNYDIFGGPIYPVWEKPPPSWVLEGVPKFYLGWTSFPEGPIDAREIWGGNMAVRANVLREVEFDENCRMNSETEFNYRAQKVGHPCWHFHAAPAGHIIRANQLELSYFLRRAFECGREDRRIWPHSRRQLLALAPRLASAACQFGQKRVLGDSGAQCAAAIELRYWQGFWSDNKLRWLLGSSRKA
jgi:GT2 family glycosyltransferase